MDSFNWDIPPSTIKNNRVWEEKVHLGYWCTCYDVKYSNKSVRMVFKASKDAGSLSFSDVSIYLVGPDGKRKGN